MTPEERELKIAQLKEKINQNNLSKLSTEQNNSPKKDCGCNKKVKKYKKFL